MTKLLLSLFTFFFALPCFSQLVETFEDTSGITGPLPATWLLNSGQWAVFEKNTPPNLASAQNWGINAFAAGIFNSAAQCASVSREGIGMGNTSEDYLATPVIHVPDVGPSEMRFFSRNFTSGDQGAIFKVMVSPAVDASFQTNPDSYTTIAQWTETTLTTNYSIFEEKAVDLSAFAGFDVYIAFVRVYTQPTSDLNGDRWLIDDVRLPASNPCGLNVVASLVSATSVQMSWSAIAQTVEVMILPCDDPAPIPTDLGTVVTGNSYLFTNLIPGNCYKAYIKNNCPGISGWTSVGINTTLPPIRLIPFLDNNSNGVMDIGEPPYSLGHFSITTNNSGTPFNVSYFTSAYSFVPSQVTDVFDFVFQLDNSYNNCLTLGNFNYDDIQASYQLQTFYFPVLVTPGCFDNRVVLTTSTRPVPGTNDTDYIRISTSASTAPQSGTLTYVKAPNTTIFSVMPSAGIVITPTGFTLNYSGLTPSGSINLTVTTTIPTIPTVNLGDILTSSASISFTPDDGSPSNNASTISQVVSASYDPNEICESHGPQIQFDQFSANDYLYYTTHFQNTGNANAVKVRVVNNLDSRLDVSTISMLTSRHHYTMYRTGTDVTWDFDNIQLPPASTNEDLSNGYFTFRIKPKAGYAIGDIIPSAASIYFDTNPAIVTETFNTEFVQALGNSAFDANTVSLSPNPTRDQVTISSSIEKISKASVYDLSGKRIYALENNALDTISIDTSEFATGMYLIELTSENQSKITKKLIIQ